MANHPQRRKGDRENHAADKVGKPVSALLWVSLGVIALVDQLIEPQVEIRLELYGLIAGGAIGAYPKLVKRLTGNGQ